VSVFEYTIANDSDSVYYKLCKYTNNNKLWTEVGTYPLSSAFPSDVTQEIFNIYNNATSNLSANPISLSETRKSNKQIIIKDSGEIKICYAYKYFGINTNGGWGALEIPVVIEYTLINGTWIKHHKIIYHRDNSSSPYFRKNQNGNSYMVYHASGANNRDGSIVRFDEQTDSFVVCGNFINDYDPQDCQYCYDTYRVELQVYEKNNSEWNVLGNHISDGVEGGILEIKNKKLMYQSDWGSTINFASISGNTWVEYIPSINYNFSQNTSSFRWDTGLLGDNKFIVYNRGSASFYVFELSNNSWHHAYSHDIGHDSSQLHPGNLYINSDLEIIYNFNHPVELKKHGNYIYCKGWLERPIQPFHFNKLDGTVIYYSDNDISYGYARHTGRTNFTDAVGDSAEAKFLNASSDRTKFTLVTKVPQSSDHNLIDQSYYCDNNENSISSNWQSAWQASPQTDIDGINIWNSGVYQGNQVHFSNHYMALSKLNPWNTTNPELPDYFVLSQPISTIIGKKYEVRYNVYGGNSTASRDNGKGFARTVQFDRTTTIGTDTTTGYGLHYFQFVATTETTYIEFGLDNLDISYDSDIDNYLLGYYTFTQIKVSLVSEQIEISVFDVPSLSDAISLNGSVIDGYVKNAPGQLIDLSNNSIIKEFYIRQSWKVEMLI
jgi:hypothetical protein